MINPQYIKLNMTPSGVLPVLHCSQYDVGRPLGFVVYNGSEAVDLDDYTVTIEATRTDDVAITATVITDGNIGVFAATATMTNKADRYPAQCVLVDGSSNRVASLPFMMFVVPAAMDENAEVIEDDASLYQQYTSSFSGLIAQIRSEVSSNSDAVDALSSRIDDMIALQTSGSMQGSKITTFVAQSAAQYTSSLDWQSFSFCDYSLHLNTAPAMSVLDGLSNPVLLSAGAYVLASQDASITDECVYVNLTNNVKFFNHGYLGAAPDKRAVEIAVPKVTDAAGDISGMWLLFVFSVVSDVPVDLSEIADARVGADGVTYQTLGTAIRTQVAQLNDTFDNLVEYNKIITHYNPTWAQNRVMISGGVLTEVTSNAFCNSGFLSIGKNAKIEVASGFKIYAWDGAYNELGHTAGGITSGWVDGTVNYTYRSSYPYLIICVMKNGTTAVTPAEAKEAVEIYSSEDSPFALQSDFNTQKIKDNTKLALVISDEIEYTVTTTPNSYISKTTGRIVTTDSNFSTTSLIEVDAGTIVYVPKIVVSDLVSIVAKNVHNVTELYESLVDVSMLTDGGLYYEVDEHCRIAFSGPTASLSNIKLYKSDVADVKSSVSDNKNELLMIPIADKGQIVYNGDTKVDSGHIVNAISYKDGIIIACRSNGKVVRIGYDGTEETLLTLTGSNMDWRCLWMDSNQNVYASPHASLGNMNRQDRGLYRLAKGASSFVKVISLYNSSSSVPTEAQENDDTIWTMCEDGQGNLYAGVYAHTVRANPAIYRSTDNGNTWSYLVNFNTRQYTTNGMHIHTIIYSKWQKALYCIVGEINTIFKSVNNGADWMNLNIELTVKGSAMFATESGIFIGSDGSRHCEIDILFNDDITHKKVFKGFANTVFAIRRSDVTGFLYAFTKVDSSVNVKNQAGYNWLYPPNSVFDAADIWEAIAEWKTHISTAQYNDWYSYYESVVDDYPDDAIRPKHCAILVSRDGGKTWEVLKAFDLGVNPSTGNTYIDGFWTTGYFLNGECVTGRMSNNQFTNPIVISEGKHKYVATGCNLDGEIFVRTNTSQTVELL